MAYKQVAGVYEIRNTLNDKVYIGSSINVRKRLGEHRRKLNRGVHSSDHLQAAWNKYGPDAFQVKQLIACAGKDVLFYEQRIIDGFEATTPAHGYNKRSVAQTNAGMKHSDETKRKVRAGMLGHDCSAETRARISAAKVGVKHTAAAKEKMSAANKGRKITRAHKEGMGKLSYEKAAEIRKISATTDVTQQRLAEMFSVARRSIGDLLRGKTWT